MGRRGQRKQSGRTFKTPTVSPASACLCPCGWSVRCLKFNCFFILSGHAVYNSLCLKSGSRGSDRSMAIRQQNNALLLSDSSAALFSPPTSHLLVSTDLAILTVLPFPESQINAFSSTQRCNSGCFHSKSHSFFLPLYYSFSMIHSPVGGRTCGMFPVLGGL